MGKPGAFKKIGNQDQTITPFKAFKSWRYETTASLDASGIDRLVAIKPDTSVYAGNKVTLDTWQRELDSSSLLVNSANFKEASLMWYSINHLYYKRAGQPFETFGYSDPYAIERTLFDEASIISIPQKQFGESIKPGSVKLHLTNPALLATSMSFVDDGKGNLIDLALPTPVDQELLYLGFNSSTYDKNWTNNFVSTEDTNIVNTFKVDTIVPEVTVTGKNVWISPKYELPSGSWGNAAHFYEDSYIRIPNKDEFNFKQSQNFAISFWLKRDAVTATDQYVLSNRTTGTAETLNNKLVNTGDVNVNASQYPFEIYYPESSNTLTCKMSDGGSTSTLSYTHNVSDRVHVLLQKTGSLMQLYINGSAVGSTSTPAGNFHNNADIFIGSLGLDSNSVGNKGFVGAIDEFFIFNKALNTTEIITLTTTSYNVLMTTNTNVVGNVFYEHGIIIISDPRPKYGKGNFRMFNDKVYNYLTGQTQQGNLSELYLEFNSTVTLYEHEYVCKLKEDEFNFTSNPTIRLDNNVNSDIPKSIVSNDYFAPYITTVGLYSKNGELIAIGKLGTPIKKRDDVDLNIIVRFDI
jgi:hypothetical protein